jgi:hypothetical protein
MRHSERIAKISGTGQSRAAFGARPAAGNHPLLRLQQSLGNRAVEHLLDGGFGEGYDPAASAHGALSISDPEDGFGRAADTYAEGLRNTAEAPSAGTTDIATRVPVQRDDDGWFGGVTDMISSAGSSIVSGIGSVVNAGESMASEAVAGVSSAIDTGSSLLSEAGSAAGAVGSAIASGAESVESFAEHLPGPIGMPNPLRVAHGLYDVAANGADLGETLDRTTNPLNYMREDAATVHGAEGSIGRGIDWLEDQGKGATHWLANQVSDVPILGSIASAGESMVDTGIDFAGGVGKGITGLGGGLASTGGRSDRRGQRALHHGGAYPRCGVAGETAGRSIRPRDHGQEFRPGCR